MAGGQEACKTLRARPIQLANRLNKTTILGQKKFFHINHNNKNSMFVCP